MFPDFVTNIWPCCKGRGVEAPDHNSICSTYGYTCRPSWQVLAATVMETNTFYVAKQYQTRRAAYSQLGCMISFVLFLLGFSTSGCNKCPCRPRARHVKGAARRVFVCVCVVKVRALATLNLALASYPLSCPSQNLSCRMIRASNFMLRVLA